MHSRLRFLITLTGAFYISLIPLVFAGEMPALVNPKKFLPLGPQKQPLLEPQKVRADIMMEPRPVAAPAELTQRGVLLRHATQANAIAVSKDGRWLASAPDDFSATLWDISNSRPPRTLRFRNVVETLTFSPDGQRLAVGTQGGEVQIWGLSDSAAMTTKRFSAIPRQILYAPDGKVLIVAFWDGSVHLLSTSNLSEQRSFQANKKSLLCIALSRSGQILATAGLDQETASSGNGPAVVRLWSYPNLSQLRSIDAHPLAVRSLSFAGDDKHLVSASDDKTAKIWNTASGTCEAILKGHQDSVRAAAFSADGKTLVTAGQDGVTLFWSPSTFELIRATPLYAGFVSALEFFPDGKSLARAGGALDVVSVAHPASYKRLERYTAGAYTNAISQDGKWFVSGGPDGLLRVIKLESLDTRKVPFQGWITAVALSSDSTLLGVGTSEGIICVLSPDTLQEATRIEAHAGPVSALAFTNHGLLSAGDDGFLRIWETAGWHQEKEVQAHDDRISGIGIDNDGTSVYSSSFDGTVKLWSLPSFKLIAKTLVTTYTPFGVSVGNNNVAVGTFGGTILFLDKTDLSEKAVLRTHSRPIFALSYSPNGAYLAAGDDRGHFFLWTGDNHEPLTSPSFTDLEILALTWYPNSQGLATSDGHSNVRLWAFQ